MATRLNPRGPIVPGRPGAAPSDLIVRRARQSDVQNMMAGRVVDFDGQIEVEGVGELTHPLWFPGRYTERPLVLGGGELILPAGTKLLDFLVRGQYPTVDVMVGEWYTERHGTIDYFVGATLVIVVTGKAGQLTRVHFRVTGKAIRGPIGSADTDTPI